MPVKIFVLLKLISERAPESGLYASFRNKMPTLVFAGGPRAGTFSSQKCVIGQCFPNVGIVAIVISLHRGRAWFL